MPICLTSYRVWLLMEPPNPPNEVPSKVRWRHGREIIVGMASSFQGHHSIVRILKQSQSEYRSFYIQHRCLMNRHQITWMEKREGKNPSFPICLRFANLSHVWPTVTSDVKLHYVGQTHCYLCNPVSGKWGHVMCVGSIQEWDFKC